MQLNPECFQKRPECEGMKPENVTSLGKTGPSRTSLRRPCCLGGISANLEQIMETIRVLCVENRPEHMEVLIYILEAAGCKVMPATCRGQALDILVTKPVDAVLLEYDLPDVTGSTLRAEIKQIKPEIPVLLFCRDQRTEFIRYFNTYLCDLELSGFEESNQ